MRRFFGGTEDLISLLNRLHVMSWRRDISGAVHPEKMRPYLGGLAIFHKPSHTKGLWKIAKSHNHLVKLCRMNGPRIFFSSSEFWDKKSIFLLLSDSNKFLMVQKKMKWPINYLKIQIYFCHKPPINICAPKNPKIKEIRKVCGSLVPIQYGYTVKNLTLTFCPNIFSWLLHMYIDSQKKFEPKFQCKIFTVAP